MNIEKYSTDSIVTWASVDPSSWEILNELNLSKEEKKVPYISPSYSWADIQKVRAIVWNWWEEKVKKILWCKKNLNKSWHDVFFPDGISWEIKTRLSWTSWGVIKREQLDRMEQDGFYIMLYYMLTNGLENPTNVYVNNQTKLSSQEYLKRNMFLKSMFILPVPYVKWFYNDERYKESTIKSSWIKFKTLSHSRALKLHDENPENLDVYSREFSDRVGNIIDVRSLGKPIVFRNELIS